MTGNPQHLDPNKITKPVDNTENQQDGHREIVFSVAPGEKKFWLKLQDSQHTWNNIPLGKVNTTAKGKYPKGSNVLVPVIPLCYTTATGDAEADKLKAAIPRPGWLYVYRNGKLWRELEVGKNGYMRDVNLQYNQNKDLRKATGFFDNRVLLPFKVLGEIQTVEMAFSEVQWSWARINKLQDDAGLRQQRMQEIDLSGYDTKFEPKLPEGNKARIENVAYAPELYHLALQRKSNIPVVYLHDPLRIAENYVDAFFSVEGELADVIEGLPQLKPIEGREEIKDFSAADKQAYYRSAVMAYRTFFDPKLAKRTKEVHIRGTVTQTETTTAIGKIGNELDKTYLEEILAVEERKELRAQVREIKRIYVEFLEGQFDTQEIRAEHPDFIDINAALLDFASLEGIACIRLWDKVKNLIGFLNHDPGVLDSAHDIASLVAAERPKPEEDPGSNYLESLLAPAHPLHKALFPSAEQIDIYTAAMDLDLDHDQPIESSDGSGQFRPAAFAAALAAAPHPPMGVDKDLKYALTQSEKIVADILASFQRQWQQALKNRDTVKIEPLLRLAKGAKHPVLAGMHIAKAGSNLDDRVIIDGKLRIMEGLNRHQRRAASAGNPAGDFINIVDPRTSTVIGSQKISDLGNFKGASPKVTDQGWTELWGKSGKVGNQFKIVRTHADLVVVPKTSPYVVKYHNPDAVSSTGVSAKVKGLRGLSKTLPPLVAMMEGWNLWQTIVNPDPKASTSKAVVAQITGLIALTYATTDAAIKIWGEDAVAKRLSSYGKVGKMGSMIVKETIKFSHFEVKIFGVASSSVAGLAAVMSAWEMAESIQLDDDDAALGHGIAIAGSAGLALAGLGTSGVTTLAFLGPYGWAFMGVAILGSVLAYAFTDSDLEKWAKHGAFSRNSESRMSHEYTEKQPQYVFKRFMGMLMHPTITMKKDISTGNRNAQGNLISDIVVEMIAPGFEPDLSTLDVRVTIEEGEVDVRGHNAKLTHLSGNQQLQYPYLVEQIYADEQSQQVIGVRYRYRAPGPHLIRWRARARHITKDQTTLPPVLDVQNITSDGLMACHPTTGQSATSQQNDPSKNEGDGVRIIDTEPGWIYAEL